MKHISESIIGRKGSVSKAVRCGDILEIEDVQPKTPVKCRALYLDNKTALARKNEIIDLCFRDRSRDAIGMFTDALDNKEGILILYHPDDRRFYWQHDSFYKNNLATLPDAHESGWGVTFVATRKAGHLDDIRRPLNSTFSYNNYFKDL